MPTVDVVIPCYNYGRYLARCVDSVVAQNDVDVRVLIIDDASSDETPQVAAGLASKDPRIALCRHETNRGHIATYNEGLLGWSTGSYVVLLSADDLLIEGSLSRAVRIMEADPGVGMVYGRSVYFETEDALPRVPHRQRGFTRWTGLEWVEGRCRAGVNVISSPEVVVRGDVQRRVGGYRPELPHAGDLEMWLRIAAVSDIAYVRGVPQAYYRRHPSSMLRQRYHRPLVDLEQRRLVFETFFQHNSALLPEGERLRGLANRALAREALWRACRAYDRNRLAEDQAIELAAFAASTCTDVERLPEFSALRRRQRLGAPFCARTQIFAPAAVVRRVRDWWWWQRWKRNGT